MKQTRVAHVRRGAWRDGVRRTVRDQRPYGNVNAEMGQAAWLVIARRDEQLRARRSGHLLRMRNKRRSVSPVRMLCR